MYLQRYHDVTVSVSKGLADPAQGGDPASQRYKRTETRWKCYEKQRLGHQLQVDVKFIEPIGQIGNPNRTP